MRSQVFILLWLCVSSFCVHGTAQETYEHYCITCHQEGVGGAPKFENEGDWKSRLKGKTLEDLVNAAIAGINVMPPQGTCYECSKEDIKAAIEYMLPKS